MSRPEAEGPLTDYIRKWHAREPEMEIGELFVSAARRPLFRRWGALVFELREAAYELSDPRVTAAKAGWWAEELVATVQGRPRHPLTQGLEISEPAPWRDLAAALAACIEADAPRPADAEAALASVRAMAESLQACEDALFGSRGGAAAVEVLSVHLLLQRLLVGASAEDAGRVPLNLLARHGLTAEAVGRPEGGAVRSDWARELAARLPPVPAEASVYRHLSGGFDRRRLARLARDGRLTAGGGFGTLWQAWRAARRASA